MSWNSETAVKFLMIGLGIGALAATVLAPHRRRDRNSDAQTEAGNNGEPAGEPRRFP
jgi:hypothetical protein